MSAAGEMRGGRLQLQLQMQLRLLPLNPAPGTVFPACTTCQTRGQCGWPGAAVAAAVRARCWAALHLRWRPPLLRSFVQRWRTAAQTLYLRPSARLHCKVRCCCCWSGQQGRWSSAWGAGRGGARGNWPRTFPRKIALHACRGGQQGGRAALGSSCSGALQRMPGCWRCALRVALGWVGRVA